MYLPDSVLQLCRRMGNSLNELGWLASFHLSPAACIRPENVVAEGCLCCRSCLEANVSEFLSHYLGFKRQAPTSQK